MARRSDALTALVAALLAAACVVGAGRAAVAGAAHQACEGAACERGLACRPDALGASAVRAQPAPFAILPGVDTDVRGEAAGRGLVAAAPPAAPEPPAVGRASRSPPATR